MPFEFLADDVVLLGVGAFANEFRAELSALKPRPTIIDLRHHPFAGRKDDPLIERMSGLPAGRLLLVGNIGNRNHVGPIAAPAMEEMLRRGLPGGYGPSRLAVLAREATRLGFRPTALRHVIRSGQERQGCLSGTPEPDAGIEELRSLARVRHFEEPHPDCEALILRSGKNKMIHTTTLLRVPEAIARFEGGEGATATLICRSCVNPLESRYIGPNIADACARKGFARLSFVGDEIVFENWRRIRRICARSGLHLYRFWD